MIDNPGLILARSIFSAKQRCRIDLNVNTQLLSVFAADLAESFTHEAPKSHDGLIVLKPSPVNCRFPAHRVYKYHDKPVPSSAKSSSLSSSSSSWSLQPDCFMRFILLDATRRRAAHITTTMHHHASPSSTITIINQSSSSAAAAAAAVAAATATTTTAVAVFLSLASDGEIETVIRLKSRVNPDDDLVGYQRVRFF